jgi:hypothetical protein
MSYARALLAAAVAAALRIKTRAVAGDDVVLEIASVETIADVDAGTVYKSAFDVFAGADCPRTLYDVAMVMLPLR